MSEPIGKALARWRSDNWGTPTDLLYEKGPSLQTLEGLLKGEYEFITRGNPPTRIYDKMASDGLVFEVKWWTLCNGQVFEGTPIESFRYNAEAMTETLLNRKTADDSGSHDDADDDLPF